MTRPKLGDKVQRSDDLGGNVALEIFLVEDNPGDVVLFKQALKRSTIVFSLTVATHGVEAIKRLQEPSSSGQPYRPDVVFLDLNLPGWSGVEVLAEMKKDLELASIPVAILTGSELMQDRSACCSIGVDAYFNKALALQDFFTLASEIEAFLLGLRSAPNRKSAQALQTRLAVSSAA
jgi:CheY-like chemotaxis protein